MAESQNMEYTSNNRNGKRRISLVDDEVDITLSLKPFLEENGFEVYISNKPSGKKAKSKKISYLVPFIPQLRCLVTMRWYAFVSL